MTDSLTPLKRSWNMSRIRSSNTKPEMLIRSLLHRMGFRFRVHRKDLAGRPDIVLPRYRTVIFVHGCFWHQHKDCIEASRPKSNTAYWQSKLDGNVERDRKNHRLLREQGWRVLLFWECEVENDPERIALQTEQELRGTPQDPRHYNLPSRRELLTAAEARTGFNRLQQPK